MFQPPIAGRSALLNVMAKAATKAARRLVRDFGEVENLQVSQKGPGDFVSTADRRAEKTIYEELSKARPEFGFLMEESGEIPGKDPDHRWVVDPLDGTTNFLHGIPHFSISIAVEFKGQSISGIVYDPIKDEMFCAEKGIGAYLNNRRLKVSGRKKLQEAVLATGVTLRSRNSEIQEVIRLSLQAAGAEVAGIRNLGSTALDMAYVAAGRLDGLWHHRFAPWDIAAGVILIQEAGGKISSLHPKHPPLEDQSLLATNGHLQAPLFKLLKPPTL